MLKGKCLFVVSALVILGIKPSHAQIGSLGFEVEVGSCAYVTDQRPVFEINRLTSFEGKLIGTIGIGYWLDSINAININYNQLHGNL